MTGWAEKAYAGWEAANMTVELAGSLASPLAGPLPEQFHAPVDTPYSICESVETPQEAVANYLYEISDEVEDLVDHQENLHEAQMEQLAELGDSLAPPEYGDLAQDAGMDTTVDAGMDPGMDAGGGMF